MQIPDSDQCAGAQHELKWLESLAVEARRNLVQAHRSGDAVAEKRALDGYLRITESLRKFDSQVAADRRDSGEMVSRAEVEGPIEALTVWLSRGIEDLINGFCLQVAECEKPEEVYTIAAQGLRQCLTNAVNAGCGASKFPLWMKQAFERGL